jgi:hypothetical protein
VDKGVEGYGLSPGELWLHSIAVLNTAEVLAKYKKFAETMDFFSQPFSIIWENRF